VDLAQGSLVVVAISPERTDKVARRGMDGAAKGFKLSRLFI